MSICITYCLQKIIILTFFWILRALTTGLTTFFCPLIPVFLGLGAIFNLAAAGFGLAGFDADAAFLAEGFALDFALRAAALADPGLAEGAAAGFFSAGLAAAAGAEAALAGAGLAAGAALDAAALGAGAGVLADAGFGAALAADAALGAAAGVLAVAGFFSAGLAAADPKITKYVKQNPKYYTTKHFIFIFK